MQRTENCQVMVLAAAKIYFQQQVTAGAACSAASQTFALGNACCFTNIRTCQISNRQLGEDICECMLLQCT